MAAQPLLCMEYFMVMTILVIEDDTLTARLICQLLNKHGYHCLYATTAQEGLRLAHTEAPAIVLMDMRLPGLTGWDATRMIKDDPALRHIPVLAVTVEAEPTDRQRAWQAGCVEYIAKPFNADLLLNRVAEHLPPV